jgi:hypothetical protein
MKRIWKGWDSSWHLNENRCQGPSFPFLFHSFNNRILNEISLVIQNIIGSKMHNSFWKPIICITNKKSMGDAPGTNALSFTSRFIPHRLVGKKSILFLMEESAWKGKEGNR